MKRFAKTLSGALVATALTAGPITMSGTARAETPSWPSEEARVVDRLVATDTSEWDGTPWRTSHASPLRVDPVDAGEYELKRTVAIAEHFVRHRCCPHYSGHVRG